MNEHLDESDVQPSVTKDPNSPLLKSGAKIVFGILLILLSFLLMIGGIFSTDGGRVGTFYFLFVLAITSFTFGCIQIIKGFSPSISLKGSASNASPAEKKSIVFWVIGLYILSTVFVGLLNSTSEYLFGFSIGSGLSLLSFPIELIAFFYIATRAFSKKKKIALALIFSVIVSVVIPLSFSLLLQRRTIVSNIESADVRVSVKRDLDSIFASTIGDANLYLKRTNYLDNRDFEAYEGDYSAAGDVFVIYPINDSAYVGKTQEEIGKNIDFHYDRMEIMDIASQKVKVEKQGSTLYPPGIASVTTIIWPTIKNRWVRIQISSPNIKGEINQNQENFVSYFLEHLPSELK